MKGACLYFNSNPLENIDYLISVLTWIENDGVLSGLGDATGIEQWPATVVEYGNRLGSFKHYCYL